jgi:dolichyl-phosphate beta-glucosyltransferase
MHIRRWAFDVEIFIIANQLNIPYAGVPISWHDVEGSKLNVVSDTLQMTRDYLLIRLLYLLALWRTRDCDKVWESFLPSEESDRKSPSPGRKAKRE